MRGRLMLFLAVGATLVGGQCRAAVLFANYGSTYSGGAEATTQLVADDFSLTTAAKLTSLRFWDVDGGDPSLAGYSGSVYWAIFGNDNGTPGQTIAAGLGVPARIDTGFRLESGSYNYGNRIENTMPLPGVVLGPGTYWLGLHNGPLTNRVYAGFYVTSFTGGSYGVRILRLPSDPWYKGLADTGGIDFELSGTSVPEPATPALWVGGFALLWVSVALHRRQ